MDEIKNVIELHKIHILGVTEIWLDDTINLGTGKSPFLTIGYFDVIAMEKPEEVCVYMYITVFQCVFFQLSIRT